MKYIYLLLAISLLSCKKDHDKFFKKNVDIRLEVICDPPGFYLSKEKQGGTSGIYDYINESFYTRNYISEKGKKMVSTGYLNNDTIVISNEIIDIEKGRIDFDLKGIDSTDKTLLIDIYVDDKLQSRTGMMTDVRNDVVYVFTTDSIFK